MGTDAISPLRQRMIEDMSARQLTPPTQKGHIRACKRFAAFLKRSPDTATAEDLRRFQLHLAESGLSICTRNRTMTGVKFMFRVTLRRQRCSLSCGNGGRRAHAGTTSACRQRSGGCSLASGVASR